MSNGEHVWNQNRCDCCGVVRWETCKQCGFTRSPTAPLRPEDAALVAIGATLIELNAGLAKLTETLDLVLWSLVGAADRAGQR